jgi:hypothetical protein
MLTSMAFDDASESRPGGPLWSRQCLTGTHVECGHYSGFGHDHSVRGRQLLGVCGCECHSTCLLTGRGPFVYRAMWDGLCDCPGADQAADRLDAAQRDAPGFGESARQWRERREEYSRAGDPWQRMAAKKQAFEAARAASAGQSRAQIREIYAAELRARGLTVPSDLVLDATADAIARNRDKFTLVYSARVLAELGRDLRKLLSDFGR